MRSNILPLAAMVASVLAAPPPADCVTKGNTVIEYYDVTLTQTVYVTEGAIPTYTTRSRHTHKPKPTTTAVYVPPPPPPPVYSPPPQPEPTVITVTYPPPPQYNAPEPEPEPQPQPQQPPAVSGDVVKDCLDTHNAYRARHGAPALKWNNELAAYAAGKTGDCVMHHSGGPYGENLAFGYGDPVSAITAWYDEKDQYTTPGFSMGTGHFTQVVWKGTKELGCYARDCNGREYLMCEYSPPGNVGGGYESNVQV